MAKIVWTEEMEETIRKMADEGCILEEIAFEVGVSTHTVRRKMLELGLKTKRCHKPKNRREYAVIENGDLGGETMTEIAERYCRKYKVGDKFKHEGKKRPIVEVSNFFMILGGGYRTCISFADLYTERCRVESGA